MIRLAVRLVPVLAYVVLLGAGGVTAKSGTALVVLGVVLLSR